MVFVKNIAHQRKLKLNFLLICPVLCRYKFRFLNSRGLEVFVNGIFLEALPFRSCAIVH